ncbi:MAG: 2-polyprenylphenol 6-hydroxylase [Pseudomonadota bacterium]
MSWLTNFRASFSLLRAVWVLMREGVITALPDQGAPPPMVLAKMVAKLVRRRRAVDAPQSKILSAALARLGPSWVKLGQFLATRPDIVGDSIAHDLELLQDRMEPFPVEEAKRMVEATLDGKVDDLFVDFGQPIAAASIAQVHKGRVRDETGERDVAIKIIRPGVRERFAWDLQTFYFAARLLNRLFPPIRRLMLVQSVDILAESARLEMELRLEAAAFSEMAENVKDDEGFRVPAIDWPRSGRDCITMEWVDGIKMNNSAALAASGHDLKKVAATLNQSFLRHAIRDGFFHADMHPGNLFLAPDGDIVAVDLGIAGRVTKPERRYLAEILYGFIRRDYRRIAEVHIEAGYVPADKDVDMFAQALRAVGEPIYGKTAGEISIGNLLTLLFDITELFEMKTQPQLIMLQKTMVVVEGVARKLDPDFNIWTSAGPVVIPYATRLIGPLGRLDEARDGLLAVGSLARQAPVFAERLKSLSTEIDGWAENGVRLDKPTIEAIGKAEARHSRSGRVALWVLALSAAAIAWQIGG